MKKYKILFALLLFFALSVDVNAASATISVKNSKSNLIVGQTFRTTVTVSSASPLGAWNFDLKYDSSKLRLTGSSFGGAYVADVFKTQNQKTATYTFDFATTARGDVKVYVANSRVIGYDEVNMSVTNGSSTVKIQTQADYEASLSKNNYLSGITVEGFTLAPAFDKDVNSYYVELPPETKSAVLGASLADSKSSLAGTGTFDLVDGDNEKEIVVTSQSGSKRIYKVNIHVKELDPIEVIIDSKKHTVVRKREAVVCSTFFEDKQLKYKENDIPGCYSEAADLTLVLLKAESGETAFYIYDETAFSLYRETIFNRIVFHILDFPKDFSINDSFAAKSIKIGDFNVNAYQLKSNPSFSLIYGTNIEEGTTGLYLYDSKGSTIQSYAFEKEFELANEKYDGVFIYIILLGSLSFLFLVVIIFLSVLIIKKNKKTKVLGKVHSIPDSINR